NGPLPCRDTYHHALPGWCFDYWRRSRRTAPRQRVRSRTSWASCAPAWGRERWGEPRGFGDTCHLALSPCATNCVLAANTLYDKPGGVSSHDCSALSARENNVFRRWSCCVAPWRWGG